MAVAERKVVTKDVEWQPFRVTREQYYTLAEMGWFQDKRVELIEGVIIEMSPIGTRHMTAVMLASHALEIAFGGNHAISVQNSFRVGVRAEPQPDIAVLPGRIRNYVNQMPTEALLIVEVSDTTLAYDRTWKMSLYVQADIQDYWIVNLDQQQVEVYRKPELRSSGTPAFGYTETNIYLAGAAIMPLATPGVSIAVTDLLP